MNNSKNQDGKVENPVVVGIGVGVAIGVGLGVALGNVGLGITAAIKFHLQYAVAAAV